MNRIPLLASLVTLCLFAFACTPEEEEEVDAGVEVTVGTALDEPTSPSYSAIEPCILFDGTRVHLVYCQDDGSGVHELMYTYRAGSGSYAAPTAVYAASTAGARRPHMCMDSTGTLHVVWEEGASGSREIFYTTINPGGSISSAGNLTNTTEDEANPRVAADSAGRVHAVWEGATPAPSSTSAIFYARKPSSVFLSPVTLPKVNSNQGVETPDIAVDEGDHLYVVWAELNGSDRNIRLVRSDDNGASFGSGGNGFAVSGNEDMTQPRIAAGEEGELFLCFIGDDGDERTLWATFTRSGYGMSDPIDLSSSESGNLCEPCIAAYEQDDSDDRTVIVAWNSGNAYGGNIRLKASPDGGDSYSGDNVQVSEGNTQNSSNRRPVISMYEERFILAWDGQPAGGGIGTGYCAYGRAAQSMAHAAEAELDVGHGSEGVLGSVDFFDVTVDEPY
jgi:hypothetical protein